MHLLSGLKEASEEISDLMVNDENYPHGNLYKRYGDKKKKDTRTLRKYRKYSILKKEPLQRI